MELAQFIADKGDWFYAITFVWTFLEGETFVIIAAFLAAQGVLNPWILLGVAWIGSFCGDQCYFWAGRRFGPRLLRRFPRWRGGVDNALGWLKKYDTGFILTFRFIYGVRNFASFALGMSGLPWRRFAILNFIAAGLWACSFVGFGYFSGVFFGEMFGEHIARNFTFVVFGVFVTMFGITFLVHRLQKRRMVTPPGGAVAPPSS